MNAGPLFCALIYIRRPVAESHQKRYARQIAKLANRCNVSLNNHIKTTDLRDETH